MSDVFICVDWGTTNLRAWRIGPQADILADMEAPLGVSRIAPGKPEETFRRLVLPSLGPGAADLPALICGMAGSTLGWRVAPYVACPANANAIIAATVSAEPGVRIVPGLRCISASGASDVMRGEETHLVGWIAKDATRNSGRWLVCHPGTHTKWCGVQGGAIANFATAMTGELFDLLRTHSILKTTTDGFDADAFTQGLARVSAGDAMPFDLFSARSRIVADGADPATTQSYLSGLLIGAEVAAAFRLFSPGDDNIVHVIGAHQLTTPYSMAIRSQGYDVRILPSDEAAIAGFMTLVERGALHDA